MRILSNRNMRMRCMRAEIPTLTKLRFKIPPNRNWNQEIIIAHPNQKHKKRELIDARKLRSTVDHNGPLSVVYVSSVNTASVIAEIVSCSQNMPYDHEAYRATKCVCHEHYLPITCTGIKILDL